MSFKQIEEIALANVLDPDTEAVYRKICRWYSKTYNTPLFDVETKLPAYHVLLTYFEDGYSQMEEEELHEEAISVVFPDFDEQEEESIEDFISLIENEEEQKRNKSVKTLNNTQSLQTEGLNPAKEVVKTYEEEDLDGDSDGLDDLDSIGNTFKD